MLILAPFFHIRRVHDDVVRAGRNFETGLGSEDPQSLKENHGVCGWSPLSILHLFDVVWDFLPDMMHIMQGIYKRIIFQLLKGNKAPAPYNPLKRKRRKNDSEQERKRVKEANKEIKKKKQEDGETQR